jgi:hypothetical protein
LIYCVVGPTGKQVKGGGNIVDSLFLLRVDGKPFQSQPSNNHPAEHNHSEQKVLAFPFGKLWWIGATMTAAFSRPTDTVAQPKTGSNRAQENTQVINEPVYTLTQPRRTMQSLDPSFPRLQNKGNDAYFSSPFTWIPPAQHRIIPQDQTAQHKVERSPKIKMGPMMNTNSIA